MPKPGVRAEPGHPYIKQTIWLGTWLSVPLSSLKIQLLLKLLRVFLDSCSYLVIADQSATNNQSLILALLLTFSPSLHFSSFPRKGQNVIYTKLKKNCRNHFLVKKNNVSYAWIATKISHDELYQGLDNMIQITMCI